MEFTYIERKLLIELLRNEIDSYIDSYNLDELKIEEQCYMYKLKEIKEKIKQYNKG